MKAMILCLILLVALPFLSSGQSHTLKQKPINPLVLQDKVYFKVNDKVDDTSTLIKAASYKLKPEEKKAVAKTGMAISKLDPALLPMLKDTTSQTRVFMIPELYYAKVAGTEQQISYRILFVDSAPLRYDFGKELFEGSIRIIPVEVVESGNPEPVQKQLSVPEDIIVSFGSTSVPLKISSVNWPPLDVPVTSPDPRDSVEVKILTVSKPLGYPKNLRVEPAILLTTTRTSIQGLGIQTLPVHVTLKGVSSYKPVPLTIETSLGKIDSASLSLSDDRPHEVILRSEGLGKIDLKVINPNYRSNSISIEAVFPWLFLLLAILGGMIGGLGKNLFDKTKVTLRPLALGSIFGLIAAVAYWGLGIVLIGFSIETRGINEAMVFGVGLIAGYFGIIVLKK